MAQYIGPNPRQLLSGKRIAPNSVSSTPSSSLFKPAYEVAVSDSCVGTMRPNDGLSVCSEYEVLHILISAASGSATKRPAPCRRCLRRRPTVPSFCPGSIEQVEYTKRPPGAKSDAALKSIAACDVASRRSRETDQADGSTEKLRSLQSAVAPSPLPG
eukprot:scaffold282345_cov32-Tisochrysis_lutea.AAC.3